MIPTIYRRDDAPTRPSPAFDPAAVAAELIDPLTSPVPPSWRMTEDPEWTSLVAELGDPRSVDAHVDETPAPGDDAPVEVAVEVEVAETVAIEAPPTLALDVDLVEWCPACEVDAGEPCRTPSGALRTIGPHVDRTAGRTAGAA